MTEAITVPMIGEPYPLPRGGGFVCSEPESVAGPGDGVTHALQCTGLELGCRRENWFYLSPSSSELTLERVRWLAPATQATRRSSWVPFYLALADSLSRVMGEPVWVAPDSTAVAWNWKGFATTVRLHGRATTVDSLEVECVVNRLAVSPNGANRPQ